MEVGSFLNKVKQEINAGYAHQKKCYGTGVGVAILDTGIFRHPDFDNRIVAFKDILYHRQEPYDDNGHGTHIAGIIGGSGKLSNGVFGGIAPKCNLVIVKVLDHKGNGTTEDVLKGIDWVIKNKKTFNIRIMNISVGTIPDVETEECKLLVKAVETAWDEGLVVVVAAGNNGPNPMTITTPGISRKVITVGASDDHLPPVSRNMQLHYSGRGPTQFCVKKPDVIAPGNNIVSCKIMKDLNSNIWKECYTNKSGTSMATPIVSGSIALLLDKYPDLSNVEVKIKLKDSAVNEGLPHNQQGWGKIDVQQLIS